MQTELARVFLVAALCAGIGIAQKPVASATADAESKPEGYQDGRIRGWSSHPSAG